MTSTKNNYHSVLQRVADTYSPTVVLMQKHYQKETSLHKWLVHLLLLQFKDIKKLARVFKDIKNINFSALPIFGGIAAPIVTALSFEVNNWVIAGSSIGLYIILFLCGLPHYFLKMLSIIEEDYFHIGAYRKFCSTEYDMFSMFFEDISLSFVGLYDFVTGVLTKQGDEHEIVKAVTEQFNRDKSELKKENKELQSEKVEMEQLIVEHYNQLINELNEETELTETALRYLVELLADISNVLYRIANNCFGYSDLKILSGITLYRLEGDTLYKLADEGTSGNSPSKISIEDKDYEHYAMIAAIKGEDESPKKNEPRKGYYVISHKMKMKKSENERETWVLNFHVNKELNRKAWQLLVNYDIISNKEVYRIFHALCLFLYTNVGTKKGVVVDERSKRTS